MLVDAGVKAKDESVFSMDCSVLIVPRERRKCLFNGLFCFDRSSLSLNDG
jgi:hypothetical protein